ncbi:hypothetical protein Gpo141_00010587 [Globisporangium polare]
MQLFVRTDTGRTLVITAEHGTAIRDVLTLVQEKELQASGNQSKSVFEGLFSKKADNGTGADAALHDKVTSETDDSDDGDVDNNAAFRAKSRGRSRYLHYGGVPLRPQRALYEYGIQNHATLELSTRLRGGCFSFSIMLWIIIFICCVLSICTCGISLGVAACLLPFALLLPLCCL